MLIKYSDCEDIGAISGTNFFNSISSSSSYTFSFYGGNWGWATWKRAWKHFDLDILNKHKYQNFDFNFLERIFLNKKQVLGLKNLFENVISSDELACSTWDFQWFFIRLKQNILTIVPAVNLITNIGLNGGTHFTSSADPIENHRYYVKSKKLPLILSHPEKVEVDCDLDDRFGIFYNWITISAEPSPKIAEYLYLKLQKSIEYINYKYRSAKYKILSSKSVNIIGNPSCIYPILVYGYGSIIYENGVCIGARYSPEYFTSYAYINIRNNGVVKFSEGVWANNKLSINCNGGEIFIGKETIIGFNVSISNSDFHHSSYLRRKDSCNTYDDIHISENVLIGSNVQICKGVKIGKNSIIAPGSIICIDIPENSIFSGNKIKPIHVNI
jgi:maltose O-acetyltransferase